MRMLDSRRLTGLNVLWHRPGAVLDIELDAADDADRVIAHWRDRAAAMLAAVGWESEQTAVRRCRGGVSLALSAPIDCLYAAVDIAEWAWRSGAVDTHGGQQPDFEEQAGRLRAMIEAQSNAPLIDLAAAAARHDVTFLSDDDAASVGLGCGSKVWPVSDLPQAIDWPSVHDIPLGIVTGTNGKTTTVRLAGRIVRAAGLSIGVCSTDWISVDEQIVERGDYSGPGGARTVLRQPNVDMAVLETARGGLLRRGLGVPRADAALITNISADHLGDFGSRSLAELLEVKWVVMRALDAQSTAVLNAEDHRLVEKSRDLTVPVCWFALDVANPVIAEQVASGGLAVALRDGVLARFDGRGWHGLCNVSEIPITMNGAARHNIANALAAIGLTSALGIDDDAIAAGLRSMTTDDNPGRSNLFRIGGFEVLLDFAHNPAAMAAVFDFATSRPAKRRLLAFGQAGDRPDALIRELARRAWSIGLDRVIISELAAYRRGREPGEVFGLLADELVRCGAKPAQVSYHELEIDSLEEALGWARAGDLVIMIGLADSKNLLRRLKSLGGT